MVQQARPRARRGWSPLTTLVVMLVIAVAVGLVGLLLWSQVEVRRQSRPMVGPGRFSDAGGIMTFKILQGWEVIYQKSQTQVVRQDGSLPTYDVETRSMEQMNLVVNWNCLDLVDRVPDVIKAISPWDAKITYTSVPCSKSVTEAVFVRVYLALNDGSGRNAVIVFAPLDGVTWVVARTLPFQGESTVDLIDGMTTTVTSVQRH